MTEEKIIYEEDPEPHNQVFMAWLTPPMMQEGDADFDVFSSIFADGKDSPLVQSLVYDKRVAQDVEAFQYSARLQGQYIISATVAEGHTTEEVVAALDEVIKEVKANGVSAEDVEISKLNWEKRFYEGLQSISRKADALNSYNTHLGDPGFVQKDLERYLAVTPDSIQALDTHLHLDKRVGFIKHSPESSADESSEVTK